MGYSLSPVSDAYCEVDQLGFDKYVGTLHDLIRDERFDTPFCIGIYGNWGSGKTSFMRLLEKKILAQNSSPYLLPTWFNPWQYIKEEHLIVPFLKTLESELKFIEQKIPAIGDELSDELKNAATKFGEAARSILYGLKAKLKLGLAEIEYDPSKSMDHEKAFAEKNKVQESSLYYNIINELRDNVDESKFRIVVFIDDLDRCLPDKIVDVFESVKLFVDLKGYIFIIGVDRNIVENGISYHYRFLESINNKEHDVLPISPAEYLDKFIQLPIELPPIEKARKQNYIESLLGDSDDFKQYSDMVLESGIGQNPRRLKRFINLLAFTVGLAETVKKNILANENDQTRRNILEQSFCPSLYVKWTIIVYQFPDVYREIKNNCKRLIELQSAACDNDNKNLTDIVTTTKRALKLDKELEAVLSKAELFPDDEWLLNRFLHLSESTVINEEKGVAKKGYEHILLPGDTVIIPQGDFLFGAEQTVSSIDYDYYIDAFPVTNLQYKEFIDQNANRDVPYSENDSDRPYKWNRDTRSYPEGREDHPVVLVTFQDAAEFCIWRSKKDGKDYRMPFEEEWEKAARGKDGRKYPWGHQFDNGRCNTTESKTQETSVANFYPAGTSPYNCYDMSGNVWEWTASRHNSSEPYHLLRGGSYHDTMDSARCYSRKWAKPSTRSRIIGFRCIHT